MKLINALDARDITNDSLKRIRNEKLNSISDSDWNLITNKIIYCANNGLDECVGMFERNAAVIIGAELREKGFKVVAIKEMLQGDPGIMELAISW